MQIQDIKENNKDKYKKTEDEEINKSNISYSAKVKKEILDKIKIDVKNVANDLLIPISIIYGLFKTKYTFENNKYIFKFKIKEVAEFFLWIFNFIEIEGEINKSNSFYELKIDLNKNNKVYINKIIEGNSFETRTIDIIKGMYLASGYISDPKGDYHLEIVFNDKVDLDLVSEKFNEIGVNVNKYSENGKNKKIYIKSGEDIFNMMIKLGANKLALKFESVRVSKNVNTEINRSINAEVANMTKTLSTSKKHIDAIEKLQKENFKFSQELYIVAAGRKKYPEASLSELAEILDISKSTLNSRLNKIIELSKKDDEKKY